MRRLVHFLTCQLVQTNVKQPMKNIFIKHLIVIKYVTNDELGIMPKCKCV